MHGEIGWSELMTRDAGAAQAFYAAMLGWTYDTMPMPEGDYVIAKAGGKAVAGVFAMKGPEFEGVPPHWFTYITVDDVNARADAAVKAGGKLCRPVFEVPGVGHIAIVTDPTGATVGLFQPAPM
jgi:predicted enzyme related to lactoylglutathione lyase